MADRYLGRMQQLARERKQEWSMDGQADRKFLALVQAMTGQKVSWRDYMYLLYSMYGYCMRQGGDSRTLQYIVLRMQQVQRARRHKVVRREYPLVSEYGGERLEVVDQFLDRKRPLLSAMRKRLFHAGLVLACVVFALLLVVFVFGLKWPFFVSLFLVLCLCGGLLAYYMWFVVPQLVQQTISHLGRDLDPVFYAYEDALVRGGLPPRRV